MSGVTHFERRDRQKMVYATCRLCKKKIKATPRSLAGERGHLWTDGWVEHLRVHLFDSLEGAVNIDNVEKALYTAMNVALEYARNK